jgi:hypothetical protein
VVALDYEFHGITQGGEFFDTEASAPNEPHLQESLADLPLGLNENNLTLISRLEKT